MFELLHAQYLVLLIVIAYAGVYTVRGLKEHRAITALGGYAPRAPASIPWGQCIQAVQRNRSKGFSRSRHCSALCALRPETPRS
jgi:hypothetical protein